MESTNVPLNHMFQRQKKRAMADLGGLSLDMSGRWGGGEGGIGLHNHHRDDSNTCDICDTRRFSPCFPKDPASFLKNVGFSKSIYGNG